MNSVQSRFDLMKPILIGFADSAPRLDATVTFSPSPSYECMTACPSPILRDVGPFGENCVLQIALKLR